MSWHTNFFSPWLDFLTTSREENVRKWSGKPCSFSLPKKFLLLGQQFCLRTTCPGWRLDIVFYLSSSSSHSDSFQSTSRSIYLTHTLLAVYNENDMGDSIKDFTKVKVNNFHCFLPIQQINHLAVESYQVSQARFPLCKSMLTTPNHPLALVCMEMLFQRYFLHLWRKGLRTTVRLTGLYFAGYPFLKIPVIVIPVLFQSSGTSPNIRIILRPSGLQGYDTRFAQTKSLGTTGLH